MKSYEKFISKEDVELIHQNTLKIFNEVGVLFENDKAIEIFKKHGAKVDGYKVFIPEKMLNDTLKTMPTTFNLRIDGDQTMEIGKGSLLCSPIGQAAYVADDGKIKRMTPDYAIKQFKMGESSSITNISGLNVAILNGLDMPEEQKALASMAITLRYSNKFKVTTGAVVNGMTAQKAYQYTLKAIDVSNQFRGIESGISMMTIINSISPLCYDSIPIEKMMAYADKNQVVIPSPCAMPLLTAPSSVASMLAMTNAEILAGLIFTQLYKPGNPIIYGNTSASTDMKSIQLSIGTPEAALVSYATAAIADYYKIPFRTGGGLSDAKEVDAQAGAETMMMLYATYDCKPDYVLHNAGCMGTFNVVSFEKFILDEEIAAMAQRQIRGIDVSEEKLCFDEIKKVGPRGTFLHGRTPKMYREEFYMAKLFNKDDPNNWQNAGSVSIFERAKEEVNKRLESYSSPVLEKEQLSMVEPYLPDAYKKSL